MSLATQDAPDKAGNGNDRLTTVPAASRRQSALAAMADRFAVEPVRLMEVLKATVIKGTDRHTPTNEEVAAFIIVANQYGLNPFTREIHAFADSQRGVVPIVGIDGWSHIINAHDQFDGVEFDEVEGEDGKPIKTTCTIHIRGRAHPIRVTERFSECKRNTGPWGQYPFRMLRHKALMQCARVAFSISGIYDEDEARDIIRSTTAIEQTQEIQPKGAIALTEKLKSRTAPPETSSAQPADSPSVPEAPVNQSQEPAASDEGGAQEQPADDPLKNHDDGDDDPLPTKIPDDGRTSTAWMFSKILPHVKPAGMTAQQARKTFAARIGPESWQELSPAKQDAAYAALLVGEFRWTV